MGSVYISGPITGCADYRERFSVCERMLRGMGYDVVNPAAYSVEGWTWGDYMQYDLALMRACDSIYMLSGWEQSKGACIERRYAMLKGINILSA